MPEKIGWTLSAQVAGGPKEVISGVLEVGAYDRVQAVVPAGGTTTVDVQPGDGAQFLLVAANRYTDLAYTVDGGSAVALDGPHILVGAGAVGLLGATQNQFEFDNGGAEDVTVRVLVGRNPSP
jgi:hypothetical protein